MNRYKTPRTTEDIAVAKPRCYNRLTHDSECKDRTDSTPQQRGPSCTTRKPSQEQAIKQTTFSNAELVP